MGVHHLGGCGMGGVTLNETKMAGSALKRLMQEYKGSVKKPTKQY